MRDWANLIGVIFDGATGTKTGRFAECASAPISAFISTTEFFLDAGTLRAIDLATPNVQWSFAGDGSLVSAPVVIDGMVLVGSSTGNVYTLNVATSAQSWRGAAGSAITPPDDLNGFPMTGFGAAEGLLVVPTGRTLTAWNLIQWMPSSDRGDHGRAWCWH